MGAIESGNSIAYGWSLFGSHFYKLDFLLISDKSLGLHSQI